MVMPMPMHMPMPMFGTYANEWGKPADRDAARRVHRHRAATFEEAGASDCRQRHPCRLHQPGSDQNDGEMVAGHGRVVAAQVLGLDAVPMLRLSHLFPEERRAYVLADNKLALNAGRDNEILAIEPQVVIDLDFDVTPTSFSLAEFDLTLDRAREASTDSATGREDLIPETPEMAMSHLGDLWLLGRHQLLCGDARSPDDAARPMTAETADLIFTDLPYKVPIDGHVDDLGFIRHREFAFASGEMSHEQFTGYAGCDCRYPVSELGSSGRRLRLRGNGLPLSDRHMSRSGKAVPAGGKQCRRAREARSARRPATSIAVPRRMLATVHMNESRLAWRSTAELILFGNTPWG